MKEKKFNKRMSIYIIIFILIFFIFISCVFSISNINNSNIIYGISIMEIDVSNLSRQDAIQKLANKWENLNSKKIKLKYNDYETSIDLNQLEIEMPIEEAVQNAYEIGRKGNIFENNYEILITNINGKKINPDIKINEEIINKKIEEISSELPNAVQKMSYYREDDKLVLIKGKSGVKINEEELKRKLYDIALEDENNISIQIPVENVHPKEINLEEIQKEIYKEAKDAYITENPFEIHPQVEGVDFGISMEEIQEILSEEKEEYIIPLNINIPEKTIDNLGIEAFPQILSTYTTRYDASVENKSANLELAAKKINGVIILPGEEFSFNQTVGKRTIENGYKESDVYSGGKVVRDVGGGICQISSTLYNTVLLANLDIVSRSNHYFLTSYVPAGRDATVYWGSVDFKFKNTRKYPIKITAVAQNGVAKVEICGIREEKEYEVNIQSKITSYIPYEIKYKEDPSLQAGAEKIQQAGNKGCTCEVYKIVKYNGNVISETLLSKDYYNAMEEIRIKGTSGDLNTDKSEQKNSKTEGENELNEEFNKLNPNLLQNN